MRLFHHFHISFIQKKLFSFSPYKGLLELLQEPTLETFSACLTVLDKLQEVFGFSIIIDFMFGEIFHAKSVNKLKKIHKIKIFIQPKSSQNQSMMIGSEKFLLE